MRGLLVLLLVTIAVAMAVETVDEATAWKNYKEQFNKKYEPEEDARRMKIFLDNKKVIDEHNVEYESGKITHKLGINQFSDQTPEEHKHSHGFVPHDKPKP